MKLNFSKKQKGLSLIELMIAVVLGIFITGGMIQLFVNSNQSYRVQENLSRLQENGRFATSFLTRDIRMADYWGCLSSSTSIDNNLNLGSSYDNFANAISGQNNTGANGSDSITISGARSSNVYVNQVPATVSSDIKVSNQSGLNKEDVVLVSDCEKGDIFQIVNDPSVGGSVGFDNVVHNTGGVHTPGNADQILQKKYGTDAQVYKVGYITYSVQLDPSNDNQPTLYRQIDAGNDVPLIAGIENMQIKYGIDTDGDFTPNYYSDALVSSTANDALMQQVVAIRIYLVTITLENNLATQAVPYTIVGDGSAINTITPADRRIRRVFSSTIAVRNRLP